MKAGVGGQIGISSYPLSTKRRWRGFVIAVLGLVILSMLVPLVFLLGFHNGFHTSGFPSEQQTSSSQTGVGGYSPPNSNNTTDEHDESRHIENLMKRLGPTFPKEPVGKHVQEIPAQSGVNGISSKGTVQGHQPEGSLGRPVEDDVHKASLQRNKVNINSPVEKSQQAKVDERKMSCELRFGSYCLWRNEYREDMMDSVVKKMKDRLFVARAYYPSIAKLPAQEKLSRELRQNIQDFERILSETSIDVDLPPQVDKKLEKMEVAIARAKSVPMDCNNVDKKFRQLVDLTEDEANFHTKQSAFLYQLAVQTMPKSLHCLSMRLTVEYFQSSSVDEKVSGKEKCVDPELHHYVIFSKNIVASSVVINSTVTHARESKKLVFHVLTDKESYYAMKLWFFRNTFKEATIQVLNIEDYGLEYYNMSGLSLPEEFRVSFQIAHKLPKFDYKTEYVSFFSYSHFLLPEIFKNLGKIVVLDDDILVQHDLSDLWKINMGSKVNGGVELCAVKLGQLNNYLGRNSFKRNSCAWMSGLNVIDLSRWRELNLTGTFRRLVQELKLEDRQYEAAASSAGLLTFQDLVYALDDMWVLSGLGHDYGLDVQAIRNSAVLHFNGNMKPWLELGIPKYRSFWAKFLNRDDQFLSECNVIP